VASVSGYERLDEVLGALDGLAVLVDADGCILASNAAYRDAFGPAGEPGAPCPGWPAEDEATLSRADECPAWAALAAGREFRALLTRHFANGATRVLEVGARPIRDAAGEPFCAVEIWRDVTERRALEAEVRQAQKMEALCTLAGGIAHDFNNILFGMLGFAELVRMDLPAASPAEGSLRQLVRSIERARGLVAQIQAFSRQTDRSFGPVDLGRLLEDQRDVLRAALAPATDLRVRSAPGLHVEGDARQLAQLIGNLATNAAQSMPGGGMLEITLDEFAVDDDFAAAHPGLRPGPHAVVSVSDTGTGIAPELLGRVFEPFFTTRELGQGNGMGLAVAHGVAAAHGGLISSHSEVGRGSTFRVYLPRPEGPAGPGPAGKERVLLVDGEPHEAEACRRGLVRLGYRVVVRTTLADALAVAQGAPLDFDVVVTALTLPGAADAEPVRQLRRIAPRLPIVITTGLGLEATRLGLGPADNDMELLQKPAAAPELARAIRRVLAKGESE
jgi:signal transduction histidine kinase/CheY-like chemotaxis protein